MSFNENDLIPIDLAKAVLDGSEYHLGLTDECPFFSGITISLESEMI